MIEFTNDQGYRVAVIADSVSHLGQRITTLQLRYPRIVHQEVMTHRVFSRNASSSRAIPVKRMHAAILEQPARPFDWRMNESGMQGWTRAEPEVITKANDIWDRAVAAAVGFAEELNALGIHKQAVNRLTEPFQFINVLITSTSWANFETLRYHGDADPTVHEIARLVYEARRASAPRLLLPGEWHLPYITDEDRAAVEDFVLLYRACEALTQNDLLIRISVARCARVSYLTHDGKKTEIEADLKLFDRLLGAQPLHASPAEHQATPDTRLVVGDNDTVWGHPHQHGNFTGWRQFRKLLPGEYVEDQPCQ